MQKENLTLEEIQKRATELLKERAKNTQVEKEIDRA